ncbi:MAG TPA: hypothetical protein VJK51_04860 [Candidatus Nanoarchaeia archaeon]|nr:hypothetical protein [Candidatus Nanoarchaeia archaeon]
MGKQIHLGNVERLFDASPVVDFKSIERIVGTGKRSSYAKLLVHTLLQRGKIYTIGKGSYTKHPELSLAVFSFTPSYLGLQSALSQYGIWEQETIPVILTIRRVRRGIRSLMGSNVLLRTIDKRYFFGVEYRQEGAFYLPYSDVEKTCIDMVVFNQRMDTETIQRMRKMIDMQRLKTYLKRYPLILRKRVLRLVQ